MRLPIRTVPLFLFAALAAFLPSPATAQSVMSASVTGTVTDGSGRVLPRVVVTLGAVAGGMSQETATDGDGSYRFALVSPGSYEIRVEAIGYAPLVARTLELGGGDAVRVPLTLRVAAPPVVMVDTLALQAAGTHRMRPGGLRLGGDDLDQLPHRYDDLASVLGLSPAFDGTLGAQGLPGSMTVLVADGLPVYRARHPFRADEPLPDALFPRTFLSGATALHHAPDIEWAGGAGGYGSMSTLAGVAGGGVEVQGNWSGGPLWSSSQLGLAETPGMTSFQGFGRAALDLKPDTTQLVLASEVLRHESPVVPRISDALAGSLAGLDSELLVGLATPSVERVSRYSGLARFQTRPSETTHVFLRGMVAYSDHESRSSNPLALGAWNGRNETSTDYSLAGSFTSEYRPGVTLEFRGGVSGSTRTFEAPVAGLSAAYLAEAGLPLGPLARTPAESARTDAVFVPATRFDLGDAGTLRTGVLARLSRYDMQADLAGSGAFLFTDADALLAGRGLAYAPSPRDAAFTTRELGAFAQYDVSPSPGLDLSLGARVDYERIPSGQPVLDTDWRDLTGLSNDEYPSTFTQFGGRAALSWDPSNDGRTRLWAVGSVQEGEVDPAHMFEVFSLDGSTGATSAFGTGLDWDGGTLPSGAESLPTLALFGPDTRAPRSWRGTGGFVQQVAAGLSVHVSGDYRRTDFLMRRRNLNVPLAPTGSDQFTRGVYGALVTDGALVAAPGADARRFPAYGAVWALDPDGWSEYRGVTVGLEWRTAQVDLFGSFTRSRTEDNWLGASAGSPDAELSPRLPSFVSDWDEGTSDFDVPDRVTASALFRVPELPGTSVGVTYRYASGRPFTARYRGGVDANGDGSLGNDVPFVPQPDELGALLEAWPCLANQAGGFAVRNGCRGPARQQLDVRVRIGLGQLGGQAASLFVDGLDLLETEDGLIDDALVLVDRDAPLTTSPGSPVISVPYQLNPGFGDVLLPSSRGRMLRVGVRIGG